MGDIRINFNFFESSKTRRLQHELECEGVLSLIRLWIWTAKNRPKGILYGEDNIDIAIAAGWTDDPDKFVSTLIKLGWIDECEPLQLHEWEEHQGWVCHTEERSQKAKRAAAARWTDNNRSATSSRSNARSNASSMPVALLKHESSNAPSPSPNPSPKPNPSPIPIQESIYREVIEHLNEITGRTGSARYKTDPVAASYCGLIGELHAEGYCLDDFKYVNRVKSGQWLDDPKMSKYLRPETLYGKKFGSYRREEEPKPRDTGLTGGHPEPGEE